MAAGTSASASALGTSGYPFLGTLEAAAESAPEFGSSFPALALLLQGPAGSGRGGAGPSGGRAPSPRRRRLVERAVLQAAAPAAAPTPRSDRALPSSAPPAREHAAAGLLASERALVQACEDWKGRERAAILQETQAKSLEVYGGPARERRALVEAQRQKWRVLEAHVDSLAELVVAQGDAAGGRSLAHHRREGLATGALEALQALFDEDAPTREKVRACLHFINEYDPGNAAPAAAGRRAGAGEQPTAEAIPRRPGWPLAPAAAAAAAPEAARSGPGSRRALVAQHEQRDKAIEHERRQHIETAAAAAVERARLQRLVRESQKASRRARWRRLGDPEVARDAARALQRCAAERAAQNDEYIAQVSKSSRTSLRAAYERLGAVVAAEDGAVPADSRHPDLEAEWRSAMADLRSAHQQLLEQLAALPAPAGGPPPPRAAPAALAAVEGAAQRERDALDQRRQATRARLQQAEAQLDAMASEDFAADFAARWGEGLRLAEGEARAGGRRQLELQAKVGGHLSLAADAQRRHADLAAARAKAAGAAAAAAEAAGEEQRRAAEEADRARVEAALREAEQQRLVPVKVKVQGLRMSRISDIQQFGQNFANSVQASLGLDDSQIQNMYIGPGTG